MVIIEVKNIPVKKIKVRRNQPRQSFDEDKLASLAGSIEDLGQLQPVIVKKEGTDFLLIAGERRLRAIKRNKQKEISAVIMDKEVDKMSLRQIQLVENIQRQDLNPLERAKAIQRLMDENSFNKKEVSKKLGVARTTLTEWLNILDVKEKYQDEVLNEDSPLSLSHITLAKALTSRTGDPTKQNKLLDGVIKYKFSRNEAKEIVDIIYKYLHVDMEKVFSAVLLKREHKKIDDENKANKSIKDSKNPGKLLLNSFTTLTNRIEELIEEIDRIEEEDKEYLIDEFLYLYQMMEIMIPELKDKDLNKIIQLLN